MCDRPGLDFSFSGLKTFALNTWQQCVSAADDGGQARCDISLAFQQAVVETLTIKCKRALKQAGQIGKAPVRTPVTNAPLVCRLLLAKNIAQNTIYMTNSQHRSSR